MKNILLFLLVAVYTINSSLQASDKQEKRPAIKLPQYIVDPYSGVMANAEDAFFVYNCDRYGTMQDYFGFALEGAAQDYAKKNNCTVLNYDEYKKALKRDNRLKE